MKSTDSENDSFLKWGLNRNVTPCFGARLVQEGNRLHYLADRASITGKFSEAECLKLDVAFPHFISQMESMLTTGENESSPCPLCHPVPQWFHLRSRYPWQLRLRIHPRLPHSTLTNSTRANMKTLPATTPQAAKLCLSPVAVWQMLLARLLEQHYGLTLNDTPFSDETVIQEHIDAGISLADAVNFLVEKYGLVRIDRRGFNWQEQSPYLRAVDILRARQATGL